MSTEFHCGDDYFDSEPSFELGDCICDHNEDLHDFVSCTVVRAANVKRRGLNK